MVNSILLSPVRLLNKMVWTACGVGGRTEVEVRRSKPCITARVMKVLASKPGLGPLVMQVVMQGRGQNFASNAENPGFSAIFVMQVVMQVVMQLLCRVSVACMHNKLSVREGLRLRGRVG